MFFTPDDLFDEEPEDSLNDETFGSGAVADDDWEEKHTFLSKSFDIPRDQYELDEENVARSVSEMVLDDRPFPMTPTKPNSIPIACPRFPTEDNSLYPDNIWTALPSPPLESMAYKSPSSSWHGDNSPGKLLLEMLKNGTLTPPQNKGGPEHIHSYHSAQTKMKMSAIPPRQRSVSFTENYTSPHHDDRRYYDDRRHHSHHGGHHHQGHNKQYGRQGNNYNNNRNNNRNNKDRHSTMELDSILMSSSEKAWVIKIQMMQIQTANPYEEDYYYQMLLFKKQQNATDFLVTPKLLFSNPNKYNEKKEYKPTEFISTLGKLSVSTVNNPRQILDCSNNELQPSIAQHQKAGNDPARKKYSVLAMIEKMYDYLLELEDLERMVLIVPGEERAKINDAKFEVADRMFSCFCYANSGSINEEFLVHVLSTRKGKTMLARSITRLRFEHARAVVYHLLGNLATIIAHDREHQQLSTLIEPVGSIIHSAPFHLMTVWMKSLVDGLSYYGDLRTSLSSVLINKLGISLVNDLVQRADHLCTIQKNAPNFEIQAEWFKLLQHIYPDTLPLLNSLPQSKAILILSDALSKHKKLLIAPQFSDLMR